MRELRIVVSILFVLAAGYVLAMNWWCVIATKRNERRGIDKHHSTVPLVTLILAGIAYRAFPLTAKAWIGVVPALDIGNWMLLCLPAVLLREWRQSRNAEPGDPDDKR